jgi:outer membrane protease
MLLVLCVTFSQAQYSAKLRKGSLSIGGVYGIPNLTYIYASVFTMYEEDAGFGDGLDKANYFPGFSASAGYFLTKNIEVFGGAFFSKVNNQLGANVLIIPSEYFYDDAATGTATQNRSKSQTDFIFGLKYHFAPQARVNPYIGLGGFYSSAKVPFVEDMTYTDTYFSDLSHEITINSVDIAETKVSALGGTVLGGLEFGLTSSLTVFAEGAYRFASKDVVHPFGIATGDTQTVKIDLGGAVFVGGLRIYF